MGILNQKELINYFLFNRYLEMDLTTLFRKIESIGIKARHRFKIFVLIAFPVFLMVFLFTSCTDSKDDGPVRVAVFKAEKGVSKRSSENLVAILGEAGSDKIEVSRITSEEIRAGKLADVDVLVHPGGSGGGQGKDLAEEGRDAVREFLREGGGYLGICAGAYLATNEYPWSLNLIDAKVVDRMHWARGHGPLVIEFSPEGAEFFNYDQSEMMIEYWQGPLLARREWDDPEVPDYESLAVFATEIAEKGAPEGIMVGNSAIVRSEYGDGRVLCSSPHPENTEGLGYMVVMAVEWLAGKR